MKNFQSLEIPLRACSYRPEFCPTKPWPSRTHSRPGPSAPRTVLGKTGIYVTYRGASGSAAVMLWRDRFKLPILPLLLALLFLILSPAAEGAMQHVLVLNSYQKGFTQTDLIVIGIEDVLKPNENNIDLKIEYMDTKSIGYESEYKKRLYELYKYKYRNRTFDLVISTDDNAFDFLREYHKDLFPGVPMVFCGVNNFEAAKLINRDVFTGIIELQAVRETIDLALGLHPGTKQVVAVVDSTPTGTYLWDQIEGQIKHHEDMMATRFGDGLSMEQVEAKLRQLSDDAIVLFGPFNRDESGEYYSSEEGALRVFRASTRPVYGLSVQVLPYGIVGGKLFGGFHHGQVTAKIAQRILAGEAVRSIPVPERSSSQYMFNYEQLQRFGINASDLPEGSIVINRPVSFYQENKRLVLITFGVVLLQAVGILMLAINIARRRRAQCAVREREEQLASVLDNATIQIWAFDGECYSCLSREWYRHTGQDPALPRTIERWSEVTHPDDRNGATAAWLKAWNAKGVYDDEFRLKGADGEYRRFQSHAVPVYDDGGEFLHYQGYNIDITERKRAEEALQKAHDELEARVEERTAELRKMVNAMAGREVRMAELKEEIGNLREQIGESH